MPKKPKAPEKTKKRKNEILFTLTGDIGNWLIEQARERGLLDKRGGIQLLIHEKLHLQKQAEFRPLGT